MRRHRLAVFCLAGLVLFARPDAGAQEPAAGTTIADIRSAVEGLQFEKALAAIAGLLATPGLDDDTRAEALSLRSQVHDASGDIAHTEADYRELLQIRPSFAPDPKLASKKARERFARLAAATVGSLRIDVDPKDATITVDGRPALASQDGMVKAIAGERTIAAAREGFDAETVTVRAVAGESADVKIRLVQNAMTLVVRTDVDGVDVTIDDRPVGKTSKPAGSPGDPAELRVDGVALGEHAIRLDKRCYASESLREMVTVNLEDRAPKTLPVTTLRPARTPVTLVHATYAGELRADGEKIGALPMERVELCPGTHLVEAVASGRVVWSQTLETTEEELALDLAPRPSVVLFGAAWPEGFVAAAGAWSLTRRVDPAPPGDPSSPSWWASVELPPATDLAVAVVARGGLAGASRVIAYSPVLKIVEPLDAAPPKASPVWREAGIGAVPVASSSGRVVLVAVVPGGPAASAGLAQGDQVVAIDGAPAKTAGQVRERIAAHAPGTTVALQVVPAAGAARTVDVMAISHVLPAGSTGDSAVLRAAWASAVGASGGEEAPSAFASLAGLLAAAGRGGEAAAAWRQAAVSDPRQFQARADYAAAAVQDAEGKRAAAAELFARARAAALASGDFVLALAASDRLSDLGVAPD